MSHESPIKTPKQLIGVIVAAFLVPIIGIIMLASWVSSGDKKGAGTDPMSDKAIAARIAPIAKVEYKDPAGAVAQTGEQVYKAVCAGCHDAGAAGAPKFGDKGGWAARLGMGLDKLTASAIKGKGAMPARGGNSDLTDVEMTNAVAYLGKSAGAAFKEVAPTAVAIPAASGATATPVATPKK